jgi:hypothetical protein
MADVPCCANDSGPNTPKTIAIKNAHPPRYNDFTSSPLMKHCSLCARLPPMKPRWPGNSRSGAAHVPCGACRRSSVYARDFICSQVGCRILLTENKGFPLCIFLNSLWIYGFRYGFLKKTGRANEHLFVSGQFGIDFPCEDTGGVTGNSLARNEAHD